MSASLSASAAHLGKALATRAVPALAVLRDTRSCPGSPAANGRDLHSWTQRGLPWQGSPGSTALSLPVPLFRTLKRHLSSNNKGKRILQKLFFSFLFVLMCDCWLQNSAINQGTIFFLLQVCQATVFPFQLTFQLKAKFSCL